MDVTNRCNSRCRICYFSLPGFTPKGRDMTLAEFRIVVERLAGQSGRFALSCEFEPLLHPDIEAMLAECARLTPTWQIRVNTNGMLLSEPVSRALVESGIAEIDVSLDAPTPELNARIRGNHALPRIVKALRRLADIKRTTGATRPQVVIRSTAMRANIRRLPEMIALAADAGAERFSVKHLIPIAGCEWEGRPMAEQSCLLAPDETRAAFDRIRREGAARGVAVDLPPPAPRDESELRFACSYVNNGFHIYPTGVCYPCVWLTAAEPYGNIFEDSLETIAAGAAVRRFQQAFLPPGPPPTCRECLRGSQAVGLRMVNDARARLETHDGGSNP